MFVFVQDWVLRTKEQHGWTDKHDDSSPLVWRELIDRGGKGMLLGGSNDFEVRQGRENVL